MWIIPKTLSHFVPATPGLKLELSEQAWMCEQSLMWRSKHSAAPTWQRRLKKGGWITHLSGRILKPSLHESFVEKFVDSLVDIPANHFRQLGSDKEKKTQDTYGHTSSSTSGQLDLFGVFGKMSKDTPRWGYGESCPIWKKKVIDARSVYSVRKKLALHIKGNECSSLRNYPTPAARDYKGTNSEEHVLHKSKGFKGHLNQLPNFIKYGMDKWATPQASDHIEGARTAKESNQKCLGRDLNQMKNWSTPTTMDSANIQKPRKLNPSGGQKPPLCQEVINNPKMNWPTPRAGNPGSRKPGTGGKILAEEAKIHNGLPAQEKSNTSGKNHGSWATPNAGDGQAGMNMGRNGTGRQQKSLGQDVSKSIGGFNPTMKLNPNWVEQLMGLSTGWTDLGSWGMELSPKPQN